MSTSDIGGASLNPHFAFPSSASANGRSGQAAAASSSTSSFPTYAYDGANPDRKQLLSSQFDDDDSTISGSLQHSKSKFLKTFGGGANKGRLGGDYHQDHDAVSKSVWATENLGPTSHPFSLAPRPSIVALPVYPPTSSSSARSIKSQSKKVGAKAAIATCLLSTAATGVYLALRYRQLLDVERKMPNVFVGGWAFLVLETIVAAMIGQFRTRLW